MLTPRLQMIVKSVSGNSVADIGSDHAYVPLELARRGIRVIATDINRGPLDIAAKNTEKDGCAISLRLGDGLSPIKAGETDEIIIAGMGGELIKKIISDSPEKARAATLILQPMNSQAELRHFLTENGFNIIKEDLAKEGRKIYNLMVAKYGGAASYEREIDWYLPPVLYGNPLFPMLADKVKREFLKRYAGLLKSKNPDQNELDSLKELLDRLDDII